MADLGVALVALYRRRFSEELDAIARTIAGTRDQRRFDTAVTAFLRQIELTARDRIS